MSNEPLTGLFYDAATGESIERELTDEEISSLPEPVELPNPQ
jgi:hypothetical protein